MYRQIYHTYPYITLNVCFYGICQTNPICDAGDVAHEMALVVTVSVDFSSHFRGRDLLEIGQRFSAHDASMWTNDIFIYIFLP